MRRLIYLGTLLGSELSRCGSESCNEQLKSAKTTPLQQWRTVRKVWPDSPQASEQNRVKTEHADGPPGMRGQSAENGQQQSTAQQSSSCKTRQVQARTVRHL